MRVLTLVFTLALLSPSAVAAPDERFQGVGTELYAFGPGACGEGMPFVLTVERAADRWVATLHLTDPCVLLLSVLFPPLAPSAITYLLEGDWGRGFAGTSPGLIRSYLWIAPYGDGTDIQVDGYLWCCISDAEGAWGGRMSDTDLL